MTHYGVCEKCHEPVTSQTGKPAWPVTGWEVQRDQGGANAIRNRERMPGRVRHETCLPREKEQPQEQGSLL